MNIQEGVPFDWADALDILNGYGYGNVTTCDIFVENVEEDGDLYLLNLFRPEDIAKPLVGPFYRSRIMAALRMQANKHWMLRYAHGFKRTNADGIVTGEVKKDLTQAYKLRRALLVALDHYEW
jgi:hypothetical protein